ncbi:hypothetical protein [Lacunimicrobium album]
MDRLPTEDEINPIPENLDGQCAVRNFLGKTRQQIFDEFGENGYYWTEDLMFMGPVAFCFYITPAVDYVVRSRCYGGMIHAMTLTIQSRLEWGADEIREAFPDLVRFAEHALDHYETYELTPEIYGDLRPIVAAIFVQCHERG